MNVRQNVNCDVYSLNDDFNVTSQTDKDSCVNGGIVYSIS